jgi:DNA-3-methyladenine glycosylase II
MHEQGVRAILGQLVSVAMAAKLAARGGAVWRAGEGCPGYLCFPTPDALAAPTRWR